MGWNVYKLLCCCGSSNESTRIDLVNIMYNYTFFYKHIVIYLQAIAREQQAAAAEKRLRDQETRGIKNPERVKRMQREQQKRDEEANRTANMGTNSGLKVFTNIDMFIFYTIS